MDDANGIYAYWESIDSSDVGTAVVIDSASVLQANDYRSSKPDKSHILVNIKASDTITYYTGFTWSKAQEIQTFDEWKAYLQQFASRIQSSLIVQIK
jgi:hypothetical protein